jgi:hypothetical protein
MFLVAGSSKLARMVLKKPFANRRQPSTDSTPQAPVRETAIDPLAASVAPIGATAVGDVVADSERDDEPSAVGSVPSSSAAIDTAAGAVTGVVGVPIAGDPAFGFSDSSTGGMPGVSADFGIEVPSATAFRAAQLDAFRQEANAGADDGDAPSGALDSSAIASGGRTEETRYDPGQVMQKHYTDGSNDPYLTQNWIPDNYASEIAYQEKVGDGSGFDIARDGKITDYRPVDGGYVNTSTDGKVIEQFDSGPTIITHPNGDVEVRFSSEDREVHHPDGSTTVYYDGSITHTPPPKEGTGGGEGEGESDAKADDSKEEDAEQPPPATENEGSADDGAGEADEPADDDEGGDDGSGETAGEGSGDESGETTGDGSEEDSSTPIDDEVTPEAQAILDAGRAYGFHPGAAGRHGSTGTGGDVDPADPAADGGVVVTGEIVDLKRRLLVDPVDPDIVGVTGHGTIGSFTPDDGVIDPSDDADTALGAMGPEDDPLGGMQAGLEPEAPDPTADDDWSQPYEIDPSMRLLDDFEIEPVQSDSILDFDGLID